jgi:GNAT superfamily N-acetyltransferase
MLEPDASDAELIRAAARNHVSWMARGAEVAGGEVVRERGLRWIAPPAGGEAALPFPGVPSRPALDRMLAGCRARGAVGIGCWASGLEPTGELAARLVARGFEWGWQPHWMAIDLADAPTGAADPRVSLVEVVPEYGGGGQALMALARARPRRFWHAVARVDGAYVGHAWAHVVGGPLGGAGIYDVDVMPEHRRKGLGRALTAAVCRPAAAAGARVATLNATGEGERRAPRGSGLARGASGGLASRGPTARPGPAMLRYQPRTRNDCFMSAVELSPPYTSMVPGSTTNRPRLS